MLTFPGHITGCIVLFAVKADEDLSKYVLECSRLSHMLWKHCFPQDTEDEAAVGISSKDEVDGMPLVDHQVRRVVRPTPAVPAPPAAAAGFTATMSTAATASTGTSTDTPQGSVPDEVVVKKSALLTMKRQVAALIQGKSCQQMGLLLGTHWRFLIKFPPLVGRIPSAPYVICPSGHCIISGGIWMCIRESSFHVGTVTRCW